LASEMALLRRDSIRLNGPSMIIIFWLFIFGLVRLVGLKWSVALLFLLYLDAIRVRKKKFRKPIPQTNF